jgi:hypothetical protein
MLRHLDRIRLCNPEDPELDGFGAPGSIEVELESAA